MHNNSVQECLIFFHSTLAMSKDKGKGKNNANSSGRASSSAALAPPIPLPNYILQDPQLADASKQHYTSKLDTLSRIT